MTMSNTRAKGNRTEREAEELYQRAGYKTERSVGQRWDRTDWFGLYDIMAIQPGRPVHFAQVKSNRAAGIREFAGESDRILPSEHTLAEYLVRHDGAGARSPAWRLMRPVLDGNSVSYHTVVDERKDGVPDAGKGVIAFLQEEAGHGR